MTRKERLEFCKICQKQKFDFKRGIVCSLTNEHADFEKECPSFVLNEKIKALDAYKKDIEESKKEKNKIKKVKEKKIRIKEHFLKEDWMLLVGFALLASFIIRLILYTQFNYVGNGINQYFNMVVFIACIVAVFFRKSKQDRNWFFSDIKFKILLASLITVINLIYVWIIYSHNGYLIRQFIILLIMSWLFSFLSSILIIPINAIIKKIKHV